MGLWDPSALENTFLYKDKFSFDIKTNTGDWYTLSMIVQRRDPDGTVAQLFIATQNVTEQKKKELEYQDRLEKESRELEKLLQVEKEYSAMLPVLRNVYDQIFAVDLETDTYYRIQSSSEHEPYAEPSGKAKETFGKVMKKLVSDNYAQSVSEFVNFDTLSERLIETENIQLPNMDGYKATHVIRHLSDKSKANIPIVAMTANAFEEDKQNAFKAGMNAHIAKPIDIGNMEEVLDSILN